MTKPEESHPHKASPDSATADPVSAMRAHIAHLEAELAVTTAQLHALESRAHDTGRQVADAIDAGDVRRAQDAILAHGVDWDALDEEVGLLKADIRVLRVLLAECHDWLEASGNQSGPGRPPSPTGL